MRSSIFLSILILAGCAPAVETPLGLSQTDEAAIRETYQAFSTAQGTDEVTQLGRFFTEDAIWIPSMTASVDGRAGIQAWFTVRAVDSPIEIEEIRGAGNLAYVVTHRTLTLDIPDWVPVPCRSLTVMEKQPDATWLISRYASACEAQPS